jgi:hypothetical protein
MNQFMCKQVRIAAIAGFETVAIGFFTGTVEKEVSFRPRTTVQLGTEWSAFDPGQGSARL